jgi:uncharacterized protein with PQ loop repeat
VDLVILVFALRYGSADVTRADWLSLANCAVAGIGWAITREPLVAVLLISLVEVFAMLPTMSKSWDKPDEETLSIYSISVIKHGLSLFAITNFTATTATYPIVLMGLNLVLASELWGRRYVMRRNAQLIQ